MFSFFSNVRKSRTHLQRIEVDYTNMKTEIAQLNASIKCEMQKKFGQEISVDALHEAVLRNLVSDIKANIHSIAESYDDQIKCKY